MADRGLTCAQCGTPAPPGYRFCGECGARLEPPPEPVVLDFPAAAPTLFSVPSPIASPEPSPADEADPNTTMVGVYAPSFPGLTPELAPTAPSVEVPPVALAAAPVAAAPASPAPVAAVPAPVSAPMAAAPSSPAPATSSPVAERAAPVTPSPRAEPEPEPAPAYRTASEARLEERPRDSFPTEAQYSTGATAAGARRRRGAGRDAERGKKKRVFAVVAALALGFALVAGGVVTFRALSRDAVQASIENAGGVEQLVIEVPDAAPGLRVRFDGEEAALDHGRAVFPLEPEDVRVGKNVVNVDLVTAAGKIASHQLALDVPYRLRPDAAGFAEEPPVFRVQVETSPGAIVLLDDHLVKLDAEGRGHHDFPLDPEAGSGGTVDRVVRHAYRAPNGDERHGSTTFSLPKAKLLVERPGTSVVTDESSLELVVGVHPEARVTLDGKPVENRGGRIETRLALPSLGSHVFTLEAKEGGAAPSVRKIEVRRVASLAAEFERFETDGHVAYPALAENPSAHRGKRVKFDGLAYHVDTKNGKSDLQVLMRDCPRGQKCPVWVSYPGVVSVRAHSWVRVAGEISGPQRFRTVDTGRVVSVPRVDAAFIVPLSK